jgi:hemerythrin-like domain-containing protein
MALQDAAPPQNGTEPVLAPKQLLLADHAALEEMLSKLANTLESNAPAPDLCESWTRFESNLRDHLDTEEQLIFPTLVRTQPAEAEALRNDHQQIRRALADFGVAVDLHTLRKASVDELIGFLRQHAGREERSAYRCVDSEPAARRGLRAMLERRAALHSLNQAK